MKTAAQTNTSRLKDVYKSQLVSDLKKDMALKNAHDVPRLEKIIVATGVGRAKDDKRLMEVATTTLRKITGQQPVETRAKKAVAGFKLRAGTKVGLKVTLRDRRMYEFLDRLVSVVLPRVRDFHGVSNRSFDKTGNYSLGISEQTVFPELTFEDAAIGHGLQITFHIKSGSPQKSKALLEKFGLPFEKSANQPSQGGSNG